MTLGGLLAAIIVAPPWNQQQAAAQAPAEASAQPSDVERELDIRYAQARLKLVAATQERFVDINRRVPNSIRRGVMQSLQDSVRDANERIKLAEGTTDATDAEVYVRSAEAQLRTAEEALAKANAANSRSANAVNATEVNRLKAEVELGKVRIEKAKHLAAESPLSNVRYELGQLREMVQELKLQVALLRDRN
jgi:ribosome-binding factor A